MITLDIFTRSEWAEVCGMDDADIPECFGDAVEFYSIEDSAVAGCQYPDGTFGAFGCMIDVKRITFGMMMDYIKGGM